LDNKLFDIIDARCNNEVHYITSQQFLISTFLHLKIFLSTLLKHHWPYVSSLELHAIFETRQQTKWCHGVWYFSSNWQFFNCSRNSWHLRNPKFHYNILKKQSLKPIRNFARSLLSV